MTIPRNHVGALRHLSAQVRSHAQVRARARALHLTASPLYPSTFLDGVRQAPYTPQSLYELRDECKRRKLSITGEKKDLVDRLANHDDYLKSRGLAVRVHRASAKGKEPLPSEVHEFNTNRALKRPHDTSTVDFSFMPDLSSTPPPSRSDISPRMPLLPDSYAIRHPPEVPVAAVMRPEIRTLSGEETYLTPPSAVVELIDNTAVELDPFKIPEVKKLRNTMQFHEEEPKNRSIVKELWNGMMEDVFGSKKQPA